MISIKKTKGGKIHIKDLNGWYVNEITHNEYYLCSMYDDEIYWEIDKSEAHRLIGIPLENNEEEFKLKYNE